MYFDNRKILKPGRLRENLFALAKYRRQMLDTHMEQDTSRAMLLKENIKPPTDDIYWWAVPWEAVCRTIRTQSVLPPNSTEKDKDLEYELICQDYGRNHLLLLLEHIRYYNVYADVDEDTYWEESLYSPSERNEIVRKYVRGLDAAAITYALTADEEITPDDVLKYYFVRDWLKDSKERSLYTPHQAHNLSVTSANRHSFQTYAAGIFYTRDHILTTLVPQEFKALDQHGVNASLCPDSKINADSLLLCADYIARHKPVTAVAADVTGQDIAAPAVNYEEALRQAALYSILGDLLIDTDKR